MSSTLNSMEPQDTILAVTPLTNRRKIVKKINPKYATLTDIQRKRADEAHDKYMSQQEEAEKQLQILLDEGLTLLEVYKAIMTHRSLLSRKNKQASKNYNENQKLSNVKIMTEIQILKQKSRAELKEKVKAILTQAKQDKASVRINNKMKPTIIDS